jgi:cation diffusion facilitator family transporter
MQTMGHDHDHQYLTLEAAPPEDASGKARLRYKDTFRVTVIGSVIDLLLAIAKIMAGLSAHSQALIADGVHSLSDLATDVIVIYAAKHAHQEADEQHPYGHGRIETAATVILGIALLAVGVGIGWDAGTRLFHPDELLQPTLLAMLIAGISVVSKEAIYHYTMHYAKKHRSEMLRANAWHSRTDAISSIVVVIGVAGTMAGLPYLDAIAAIVVALMIVKIGWDLGYQAIKELIDTGLEPELVEEIREKVLEVKEVQSLHMLRTRRMGGHALADVHIQVSPRISVSEGHQIAETVRQIMIREFEELSDVMVHIDPENDEAGPTTAGLPLRSRFQDRLKAAWEGCPAAEQIKRYNLHYLNGHIELEIFLPVETMGDSARTTEIKEQLTQASRKLGFIGNVRVYYS